MNLQVSFRIAVRALGANKLRAGLTMLGMIIGVGAVIAMVSIGNGARLSVTSQIQSMGTNLLFVRAGAAQSSGVASSQGTRPSLAYEDALAIAEATGLFGETDPIGQTVKISVQNRDGVNFKVVGVLEAKGGTGMGSHDDQIIIPITTMMQRINTTRTSTGGQNVSTINIQVTSQDKIAAATTAIGVFFGIYPAMRASALHPIQALRYE